MADSSVNSNAAADVRAAAAAPPITPAMLVVWHARRDLQLAFDLGTSRGRRDFAEWFALETATAPAGHREARARSGVFARLAAARRGLGRAVARLPPMSVAASTAAIIAAAGASIIHGAWNR
jgi:hypothetical protein